MQGFFSQKAMLWEEGSVSIMYIMQPFHNFIVSLVQSHLQGSTMQIVCEALVSGAPVSSLTI